MDGPCGAVGSLSMVGKRTVPVPTSWGGRVATHGRRFTVAAFAAAVLALLVSAGVLVAGVGGSDFGRYYSDLSQLAAASAAAVTAGVTGLRHRGRSRAMWLSTAFACSAWAGGEAVWSWYELARGVDTPFPSTADIGFLVFPVFACVALLVHPARGTELKRGRRMLDAAVATTALALVSWQTVLGAVAAVRGVGRFELTVSLAYPLSDFLLIVLVVLTLSDARGSRAQLWLLASGMTALSVSDSGFAYLTATGAYDGGAVDLGWIAGFMLIALAPLVDAPDTARREDLAAPEQPSFLPYVPVAVAGTVTVAR